MGVKKQQQRDAQMVNDLLVAGEFYLFALAESMVHIAKRGAPPDYDCQQRLAQARTKLIAEIARAEDDD